MQLNAKMQASWARMMEIIPGEGDYFRHTLVNWIIKKNQYMTIKISYLTR